MSRLVVLFFAVRLPRPPPGIIDAAYREDEDEETGRIAVACDVRRIAFVGHREGATEDKTGAEEEDVKASTVMWLLPRLITATPNSTTSSSNTPPPVAVLPEAATARRR